MTPDVDNLCRPFRDRVLRLVADPLAQRLGVTIVSAFRTVEQQKALYDDAVRRYGPKDARKWVAPPGKSNHGPTVDANCGSEERTHGRAVDLGVAGYAAVSGKWPAAVKHDIDQLAARYGLFAPMEWEDWHYEPLADWVDPAPGPPPPMVPLPLPFQEETDMLITDPRNGDTWRVNAAGAVNSFTANGENHARYYGGLNTHPEWHAGLSSDGFPEPLGPAVAAGYWYEDPYPDPNAPAGETWRGYWIVTQSPADGQFHTYRFSGDGRDRHGA